MNNAGAISRLKKVDRISDSEQRKAVVFMRFPECIVIRFENGETEHVNVANQFFKEARYCGRDNNELRLLLTLVQYIVAPVLCVSMVIALGLRFWPLHMQWLLVSILKLAGVSDIRGFHIAAWITFGASILIPGIIGLIGRWIDADDEKGFSRLFRTTFRAGRR
jgi:hypothetical protein